MAEIQLNKEDCLKILNDPDANDNSLIIAAAAILFFTVNDAETIDPQHTRPIAAKLIRMTDNILYADEDE